MTERLLVKATKATARRWFVSGVWAPLLICAVLACSVAAKANTFPSKPITLILPFPAGGVSDVQVRALANAASRELGQPIIVSNRPGIGGTLAPAAMARSAAPDGYTISLVVKTLFRLPHLMKVSYDPLTDFTYLIGLSGFSYGVVVRQDAPWKTLQELLDQAKATPGEVTYGTTGKGSSGHVAMERLAKASGTQFNLIPYKGTSEEVAALLGGHLMSFVDPGWGVLVESGKARVLATMGEARLKRWPQVPTLKELGYNIVVTSPIGLVGPKGMDPKVVKSLHDAFRKAMSDSAYVRTMEQNDQVPEYMSSEAYTRFAAEETAHEKVLVQELGIKLD